MRLDVVTIFPEYLQPLRHALLGRAIEKGILQVGVHNLRDWTHDVHRAVDDSPYGGGPGMVMKPEVWGPALDDVAAGTGPVAEQHDLTTAQAHRDSVPKPTESAPNSEDPLLVVPTPAGDPFTQDTAARWAKESHLVFACGRYEGIDQRVFEDARNRYLSLIHI